MHRSGLIQHLRDHAGADPADARCTFVGVIEVERFAALRRSIGYGLANRLLEQVAERLAGVLDEVEIGRIGRTSIEFAFRDAQVAAAHGQLLLAAQALEQPIAVDGFDFELSVKIGFADAGRDAIRDELVDQAAAALAAAQAEHVKVAFASGEMLERENPADLELIRALPMAIRAGELQLHYQPKLHARQNRITAAEALARWTHPEFGAISPERFIAFAEQTGAIRELTEWVIERAVSDQAELVRGGHDIEVSVNISGQLLPDRDFARRALELVAQAAAPFAFEITETAVVGDPEAAIANLHAFRDAGIRVAIDDYGSGLSSLAYLKQLPAQELKIDRMFVRGLTESHRDPLLVRSSIDLAHALEMEVTAEGVEDPMVLSLLRVMGCDLLQGYLISPPVPLAELRGVLSDETHLARLAGPPPLARGWGLVKRS